jgi:hypothetical protein
MTQDHEVPHLPALLGAPPGTPCPSAERLARAAAGELPEAEHAAVVDHLTTCGTCSEDYRVAAALGPWAQGAAVAFDEDEKTAAAHRRPWRFALAASALLAVGASAALGVWGYGVRQENAQLRAALLAREPGDAAPAETGRDNDARTQAAVIAELEQRLARAEAPEPNAPIIDLLPRDAVRGDASSAVPRVPADVRQVTFVITPTRDPVPRDHEIEIVDPAGAVRWRGTGLRANSDRVFTLTVPRTLLPAGRCRVRLYETRGDTPRLVDDYLLLVSP